MTDPVRAWTVTVYRDASDRVVEELREVIEGTPQLFAPVERYLLHTVGVQTPQGERPLPIRIKLDPANTINEAFATIEQQIQAKAQDEARKEISRLQQASKRSQLTAGLHPQPPPRRMP